jgi:hypothetical protein
MLQSSVSSGDQARTIQNTTANVDALALQTLAVNSESRLLGLGGRLRRPDAGAVQVT